ncbi:ras-related protein Rab-22A [Exaiptasia diaphana]|uniref:Ras-related protein Rab-22A n=1 Tax=Exaiptasia diaphana TaxID=2652724 RepID=A0A913WU58_EXADI|nr:ras-related protein Rab-22A [Exaiptasia diaphana]KXJ17854.1 Ras-related protein Rab-22A [Exaiptasia diaphana]
MSSYSSQTDSIRELKVCLLGDAGVGKSCLVHRFVSDVFNPASPPTIGAAFMTKMMIIGEDAYKFNIWDTAGQERFKSLAPLYYRDAAAAILVYDITSDATFRALRPWIRELQRYGTPDIVIAIAGNKCDKADHREVPTQEAQDFANSVDAVFAETSARTSHNVYFLFEELCKKLPQEQIAPPYGTSNRNQDHHRVTDQAPARKNCCS